MPATGVLLKWLGDKGFGFIKPDDGSVDCFTHIRQLSNQDVSPAEGMRVSYEAHVEPGQAKPKTTQWTLLGAGGGAAAGGRGAPMAAGAGGGYPANAGAGLPGYSAPGYNQYAGAVGGAGYGAPQLQQQDPMQMQQQQQMMQLQQLQQQQQQLQQPAQQQQREPAAGAPSLGSEAPNLELPAGHLPGLLKKWSPEKGYGFIQPENSMDSFFAHIRQCSNAAGNETAIHEGLRVSYIAEWDHRQSKMKAAAWRLVDTPRPGSNGGLAMGGPIGGGAGPIGGGPAAAMPMGAPGSRSAPMAETAAAAAALGIPAPPPPVGNSATKQVPLSSGPKMATMELEVAERYMVDLVGPTMRGLEEIRQRAGGDVEIEFAPAANTEEKQIVKVTCPSEIGAGVAMCLILDRLADVVC